jgi:hypothetical protein
MNNMTKCCTIESIASLAWPVWPVPLHAGAKSEAFASANKNRPFRAVFGLLAGKPRLPLYAQRCTKMGMVGRDSS